MAIVEVKVPDIGDFDQVAVIEVLVKAGDTIKAEQSLITVESDKASMEIPSSHAGVVREMKVALGDAVKEGSVVLLLETAQEVSAAKALAAAAVANPPPALDRFTAQAPAREAAAAPVPTAATPPVPAPVAPTTATATAAAPLKEAAPASASLTLVPPAVAEPAPALAAHQPGAPGPSLPHASPSVRRLARVLGVPLDEVRGSGPKGRITPADVEGFVKRVMSGDLRTAAQAARTPPAPPAGVGAGLDLLPWPKVDFAKFGPVERKELSRIKKISGANLHRNWVVIPHVTNHDDADVTDLEAFRVQLNHEHEKSGIKVTMLAFLIKACVAALKKFPEFNASLDGDQLVLKQYFHIGFAADTPNGLVVPVIRDADRKGLLAISQEMSELAKKAREGKLGPSEMTGGCFSISSLGGIGGRYFTPIINAPEVAILGVCKSSLEPRWDGQQFVPRLILPLSLSWDHRVIDGAAAARFNAYLAQVLADFRRVLL